MTIYINIDINFLLCGYQRYDLPSAVLVRWPGKNCDPGRLISTDGSQVMTFPSPVVARLYPGQVCAVGRPRGPNLRRY